MRHNDIRITFRMDPETHRMAELIAVATGGTLSSAVRMALRSYGAALGSQDDDADE